MKAFKENGGSLAGTPQQQLLDEIEGHSVEIGRMRVALISFFRLLRDSEVLMDNHRWGLHRYPSPTIERHRVVAVYKYCFML